MDSTPIQVYMQPPAPPRSVPDIGMLTQHVPVPTNKQDAFQVWLAARSFVRLSFVFVACFLVSTAAFTEWILCWVPKSTHVSGRISLSGSFMKALFGTGVVVLLETVFRVI